MTICQRRDMDAPDPDEKLGVLCPNHEEHYAAGVDCEGQPLKKPEAKGQELVTQ